MSVLAQIKARKEAELAAAPPPIQTGMASSQESPVVLSAQAQEAIKQDEGVAKQDTSIPANAAPTIDEAAEQAFIDSLPDNSYLGIRLKKLVLSNGSVVKPNADGIFVPKSDEEQKMLDYYVSQGEHVCRKLK